MSRGAPADVVVSPPAFDATRTIATQVIGENRPAVMLGDEVIPGAIAQARAMLEAAEHAWLVALRVSEREGMEWVG